jgi:hypothetical protein
MLADTANNPLLIGFLLALFGSLVAGGLLALASGHLRTRRGAELTRAEVAAPGVLSLATGLMGISGVLYLFVFRHAN